MQRLEYRDFELYIEQSTDAPSDYNVKVIASPRGQTGYHQFKLPYTNLELENFILKVGRPRRGRRGLSTAEGKAAKEFGGKLYEAVFENSIKQCFDQSLVLATNHEQGLRIRLRLNNVPELMSVPWEFLYDNNKQYFFSQSIRTPIVRCIELESTIRPFSINPPLEILVMISKPKGLESLDVEHEWQNLKEAVCALEQQGLVIVTRLENATLTSLQRQLRKKHYHVFHYIGHGYYDESKRQSGLILEDEGGIGTFASGEDIATLFYDHRSLRLAVLNACEGARVTIEEPFSGVAQSLIAKEIPAVLAMQFEITDQASITLANEFYSAMSDGYPVDAAIAEVRKSIFAKENDLEWGTPVLYMQADDGHIFKLESFPQFAHQPSAASKTVTAMNNTSDIDKAKALLSRYRHDIPLRISILSVVILILILFRYGKQYLPLTKQLVNATPTQVASSTTFSLRQTPESTQGMPSVGVSTSTATLTKLSPLNPTNSPVLPTGIVNDDHVFLRSGPNQNFSPLNTIQKDTGVVILGKNALETWYQIQLSGGQNGWMHSEYVDVSEDLSIDIVATPTAEQVIVLPTGTPTIEPIIEKKLVELISPTIDTLRGVQQFVWKPNFELQEGQAFELVFWKQGQDPMIEGFSPTTAQTLSNVTVDLDATAEDIPELLQPGTSYHWGILLVKREPNYTRLQYLGAERLFTFSKTNQSNNSSGNSSASPTPQQQAPTSTPKPSPTPVDD